MENVKIIAVIGASEKKNFSVFKELANHYHLLLFNKNEKALSDIYQRLIVEYRDDSVEKMDCAVNASWEADVIILSGFCASDLVTIEKIKEVATGKTIIIMENEDDFTKSINRELNFDLIYPYSKIVEVINVAKDKNTENEFLVESKNAKALETVSTIFERCGFITYVSHLH
jgi:hypothetical protein